MKDGEIEIKTDERKKLVVIYGREAIDLRSDIEILTVLGM